MNKIESQRDSGGTGTENPRPDRAEGKEAAGAQQEGKGSNQAGQADRKTKVADAGRRQEAGEAKGDRGEKGKTWTPPHGEQGVSNRPNDEDKDGPERGTKGHPSPDEGTEHSPRKGAKHNTM